MNKYIQLKIDKRKKQIDKLNSEIEDLNNQLKEQSKNDREFEKIVYKGKEFRIYKWENKSIKDFVYPKGFDLANFQDFIELYDNGKVELEVYKYYFVKHFSKIQQTKEYRLSGLCLNWSLDLWSDYGDLAYSDSDGRVVIEKVKK